MDGLEVLHARFVRHHFARHSHDAFAVVTIDAGASSYWYRGAEHVVSAGMVSLLNPGEVHTGRPVSPEGYAQRTVYLEPERLWGEVAPRYFKAPMTTDPRLRARLNALHDAVIAGDELELPAALDAVTEGLLAWHADATPPRPVGVEPAAVRRLRELIEDDPGANIHLQTMANAAGASCAYLSRAFRAAYGLPPHAYRLQVRLEAAKRRLGAGVPAAQLALELGFSSQSHFVTQFKRWTGVTPGAYGTA